MAIRAQPALAAIRSCDAAAQVNSIQKSKIRNQQPKIAAVACPFCGSTDSEMIALFGQQLMTTQHYCHNCHSAFEAVKWENGKSKGRSEKVKVKSARSKDG